LIAYAADELIRAHAARTLTFAACADLYLKEHLGALKNDKHRQQWRTSIETANAAFGSLNVASVDTAMARGVFTIPANRMKAGVEHEVPLAPRALAILRDMHRVGDYIFPGAKHGKPLSNMAMLQMMRGKAGNGYTTHGMRSAFNDWAADQTNFPREVVQHALAHKLPDKVEAAYRRRTAFPKRVKLMEAWAKYCERPVVADNVVGIGLARNGG
jgi:integrase-like protein